MHWDRGHGAPGSSRRSRRGLPVFIFAWGLALLLGSSGSGWTAGRTAYVGRPLIEVLQSLRARGLNLIYSTAVVSEKLRVTVEPEATEPRAILDEILPPLGLEARNGPGDSVLIVRASQPAPGRLTGRVLSSALRRPIVRATVALVGTTAQTTTRPDGTFEIAGIPAGTYELAVTAPGYSGRTVGSVRIEPGETAEVQLSLEARPRYAEEIVVTPGRHAIVRQEQASRLTVGQEDAVVVPTIGGDVSRVVERLPGVAAPDNSAAFHIRGSETQDVSLVLDGLELYQPFHLRDFHSPFSLVDSKIVDTIDLFGGGFTADFGDRTGGFVELSTGLPTEPDRTRVELGTLNTRVAFGTPLSSGSLLLSARTWYPEALRDTIELGESGLDPRFGDAYLKYSRNVSPRSVVSAHALLSYDRLEHTETGGNETVSADDESGYLWLRVLHSWSPAVVSETILSAGRLTRARRGTSEPEDDPVVVIDDRTVDFFGLKHDVKWEIGDAHVLKGGFEIRPLEADYRYTSGPPGETETLQLDPSGTSFGAYAAHRTSITDTLATEVGLRWDHQTYTHDHQLSPRFNLLWRPGNRSEVQVGLGRFFQSQRIHELRVEDGETVFLPAELSRQLDVTFRHRLSERLHLRVDGYYRRLSRLHPRYENLFNPLELFPETEADRVLVAPTRAHSRGLELLLRSDSTRRFFWWASYAWSSAEDVIEGSEIPRSWDQTHAGKFLLAWRWDRGYSASLSGTVHTGWPTTPVRGEPTTLPDGTVLIEPVIGPRNSARFPGYARLDLKAGRSFPVARGRLHLDLEIVNLTDRDNVCCVDDFLFDTRPDGTVAVRPEYGFWLGFTPSFSVLWEF